MTHQSNEEQNWHEMMASLLEQVLSPAEQLYGKRDPTWNFLGFVFSKTGPHIHYLPFGLRYIGIVLSDCCIGDKQRSLYQLSHEAIHLLAPTGKSQAPWIEEGVATHFALVEAPAIVPGYDAYRLQEEVNVKMTKYAEPLLAVRELLALDPNAVRRLRDDTPGFSDMTPDLIVRVIPSASMDLAERLCLPFQTSGA